MIASRRKSLPRVDRDQYSDVVLRPSTAEMVSPFMVVTLFLTLTSVSRVLGELECQRATVPSDSSHFLMTASADEARNTAVCHAICLNYIFEGQGSPISSNGTASTNGTAGNSSDVLAIEVCAIS